jgi:hypothetical protein
MAEDQGLSAVEYLDRFFDELRDEVRSNPRLAERLVKALGGNVVFDDEARTELANPYVLASGPKSAFFAVFSGMKPGQLKRVLRDNNLASPLDLRGKNPDQLLNMLYERAASKVAERKSSIF